MMYFILISSTWALAATHMSIAPALLTILVPSLFTLISAVRVVFWWTSRKQSPSAVQALSALKRTQRLSIGIAAAFTLWSFLLYPYGNAYQQSHVAFYMAITVISCIFCLMHVRSAAFIVAIIVNGTFIVFFATTGQPTFLAIAINILLVSFGMLAVLTVNYGNFERMIVAQQQTQALSNENLRLANIDSLTGLPNRRAFFQHLSSAFESAKTGNKRLAVGVIDLDGFKPVNDLYGHSAGDRLLVEVSNRLGRPVSSSDLFLSRLGGDEFAFVISEVADDHDIVGDGNRMCDLLRSPFNLPDATIMISGSIGIAVFPDLASSPDELFDRADYALYHGKRRKRGNSTLFTAQHVAEIHRDARVEQTLKQADLTSELSTVFQPIVDIAQHRTTGFEALARWNSPHLGQVSPGQFIPIAERAGIIGSLTRPLLKKALDAAVKWPADIRLSFNLSAQDLNSSEAVIGIIAIIETSGFPASRLDLEITETAFIHDTWQARQSVEMLRQIGCGISLDDFGTGYSSLTSLHSLPLTKIKIDHSFVHEVQSNPASYKIVKSVLILSREMGLDAIVEGVETAEQMAVIRNLGATLVQGYYFSRPMAESDIADFLCAEEISRAAEPLAS
ncbi:putative bifunctional diguanylate cyclase/phosphodiesterase [Rhizobium skierniewicense]|uniref:putative bifunctional diguanylate cyclase/phosphodiesterase n=1 Tax=Rhizobium skierniewicense TaxID=984260 RepID=UPI001572A05B|nr:EAL domain-containing protein [Rhizobium skierniewicense]NTF32790.1 EAL domain-containing protein [Rhizobium skierniewicense]